MKKLEEAGRAVPMILGMLPGLFTMMPSWLKAEPPSMAPRNTFQVDQ